MEGTSFLLGKDSPVEFLPELEEASSGQPGEYQELVIDFIVDVFAHINQKESQRQIQRAMLTQFELMLLCQQHVLLVDFFGHAVFLDSSIQRETASQVVLNFRSCFRREIFKER